MITSTADCELKLTVTDALPGALGTSRQRVAPPGESTLSNARFVDEAAVLDVTSVDEPSLS